MTKPSGSETLIQVVLSVSPNDEDCVSLERILKSDWTVPASATPASALSVLREITIPILFCDCDPTPGTWHEMLDRISLLPDAPLSALTSRLADERLRAGGLNLGAWDVVAKPFQSEEAIRIVDSASQHWQDLHRDSKRNHTKKGCNRSQTDDCNWNIGSREENKQLFWRTMN